MSDCTHTAEFDEQKIDAIFAELDQCCLPGAASAGGAALGMAKVFVDWPWYRSSVRAS